MSDDLLPDDIASRPAEVREALMVAAINQLGRMISGIRTAMWANVGAIAVGIIVYLVTRNLS